MRMLLPSLSERREIRDLLNEFFDTGHQPTFNKAVRILCRFYRVKRPEIEWYEYIDNYKTAGRTFECGKIILVHPENWKRSRTGNTKGQWVLTVLHEFGHFILWSDPETKADLFAVRMLRCGK